MLKVVQMPKKSSNNKSSSSITNMEIQLFLGFEYESYITYINRYFKENAEYSRHDKTVVLMQSCDASLLLETVNGIESEQKSDRSFGMRNFKYVKTIKEALEEECPMTYTALPTVDPTLDPNYAEYLKGRCPTPDPNPKAVLYARNASKTPMTLDNMYYKNLLKHKGLLMIDQQLTSDPTTSTLWRKWRLIMDISTTSLPELRCCCRRIIHLREIMAR
ncbi:Peroxidase 21 [Hibiscus syriacus]|uniref:peroxidase n=1 Tax=Hibiscus syriacus TaxID=106335 RepID=A0A6A3BKW6_HIBSY|nr:Peroxidase 21 [Hibiscus syriacus]